MYGMVACAIIVIFNGIGPFLQDPFDTRRFIVYYIGASLFRSNLYPILFT